MIGTGIFSSPGAVLRQVHNSVGLSLIVWFCAGLLSLLGGLCFAELAATIPKAGGPYNYLKTAFHPLFGFLFTWACLLCLRTGSLAIISIGFGEYLEGILFSPNYEDIAIQQATRVKILAMSSIFVLTFINLFSVKKSVSVQHILVMFKFIAIALVLIFAIIGISTKTSLDTARNNFSGMFEETQGLEIQEIIRSIGEATVYALWAYDGFSNITSAAEEMKNPGRNIPIAIITSVTSVIITYMIVNIAYLCVIPSELVASSKTVAVELSGIVAGKPGEIIMKLLVSLSALGAINGGIITTSRIFFAAARAGEFPFSQFVSQLTRKEVPYVAVILQGIASILLVIPGNFDVLVKFFGFTAWIFYILVVLGLIRMRFSMKDTPRPFQVRPYPLIPLLFITGSFGVLFATFMASPYSSIAGLCVVLSGIPLYGCLFWKGNIFAIACRNLKNFLNFSAKEATSSVEENLRLQQPI